MKKHSKVLVSMVIAAMFLPLLESCKKGEEDPGLSLKSRKGRVAGDWVLAISEVTRTNNATWDDPNPGTGNEGDVIENESSWTQSWDGTSLTYNSTNRDGNDENEFFETVENGSGGTVTRETSTNYGGGPTVTTTQTGTYTYTNTTNITFGKDGTFSSTEKSVLTTIFDETEDEYDLTTTSVEDNDIMRTGRWAFLGKDKTGEFKNKERIGVWWDTEKSTYIESDDEDYTDKDDMDLIDYEDWDNTDEDTWTYNDSYSSTVPDEVWELVRLSNKELKATVISNGNQVIVHENKNTQGNTTVTTTNNQTNDWTMKIDVTLTQD